MVVKFFGVILLMGLCVVLALVVAYLIVGEVTGVWPS